MRRLTILGVLICCLNVIADDNGDKQKRTRTKPIEPPPIRVNALMHSKLESAQELIKALALEDFEMIQKHSQRLELLSIDAGWNIIQTKDYTRISKEFREAARHMRSAADKQNLDAVGLGYMKLTMSCIDCHRHVRKSRNKKR